MIEPGIEAIFKNLAIDIYRWSVRWDRITDNYSDEFPCREIVMDKDGYSLFAVFEHFLNQEWIIIEFSIGED